jgi:hypothetical protein
MDTRSEHPASRSDQRKQEHLMRIAPNVLCASLTHPALDIPCEVASPQSFAPFLQRIGTTKLLNTCKCLGNPLKRQDYDLPNDLT